MPEDYDEAVDRIRAWLIEHELEDRCRLAELVAFPSVSSDPSCGSATKSAVEWLAAEVRRVGFTDIEVHGTSLYPILTAAHRGAGPEAPTVLAYGHVDVQPVEPLDEWASPPYEVVERRGRLWGRGVTDDKGQLLMYLRSIEAWLETAGSLPVNVLLLVDSEEEIGSPSLPGFLDANPWLGEADVVAVSDSPMLGHDVPALGYALRGLLYVEVTVRALVADVHSGQFGGAVPNAARVLTEMVAGLHDDTGRVTIPGFYDDVVTVSDDERARLAALPFDEEAWRSGLGARCGVGEDGFTTLERTWIRPTLEVNGLVSGHTGPGPKTIVPAEATAKLSCRLVPNQDPSVVGTLVVEHLKALAPATVDVTAAFAISAGAVVTDTAHPYVQSALTALGDTFGSQAHLIRDGGTIPAVTMLQQAFDLPALLLGFGCPDENKHAPNEWLSLDHFRKGPEVLARLWAAIARSGRPVLTAGRPPSATATEGE